MIVHVIRIDMASNCNGVLLLITIILILNMYFANLFFFEANSCIVHYDPQKNLVR